MKTLTHSLLFIGILLLLNGCNTIEFTKPLSSKEAKTYAIGDNPNKGYLIGSFAYAGKDPSKISKLFGQNDLKYTTYGFLFASRKEPREYGTIGDPVSIGLGYSVMHDPIKTEDGGYVFFAVPLDEGEYFFYNYYVTYDNVLMKYTWSLKNTFFIPFNIKAGTCTYIGEVKAHHLFGKGFGAVKNAGIHFECSDKESRDLPNLVEKYPFLKDLPVEKRTIDKELMLMFGPYKGQFIEDYQSRGDVEEGS